MVEFGELKIGPIRLTEKQVMVLAEYLPCLCDAFCASTQFFRCP